MVKVKEEKDPSKSVKSQAFPNNPKSIQQLKTNIANLIIGVKGATITLNLANSTRRVLFTMYAIFEITF